MQHDGIDKSNTLFVVTVDEGDHFAGGTGTPDPNNPGALVYDHTNCLTPTSCPANQIGEVNANINAALPAGEPPFDIHFDDAPTFYVNGQPERTNAALRKLEQDTGAATLPDPYKGGAEVPIAQRLADTVEEETLHMVNSDPKRTPSFTMFGDPDFFFQIGNVCKGPSPDPGVPECVNSSFAWNHGDSQDEIGNTWFGIVGPGVDRRGVDSKTWTDHVDLRPTINALLGLQDNYVDDGRVVTAGPRPAGRAAGARQQERLRGSGSGVQADQRAVRAVRDRHAGCVDGRAQDLGRTEVRLDRGGDREPDAEAERAGRRRSGRR